MRAYLLSIAGAAVAIAATSADAFTRSYGSSLASACYRASMSNYGTVAEVKDCTRAIDEEALTRRDYLATIVNRGIVRMNLRDYRPAEADFDEAIAMDADYAEAYLNKGFLRLRQDRPSAAVELLNQSLEKSTRMPALAYYARGVANERLGKIQAAYADLQKAHQLAPWWSLPRKELQRYVVRGQGGRLD
jgi:tetratricopeptide (TPR) repeat protein